jgi:hypothetical protein
MENYDIVAACHRSSTSAGMKDIVHRAMDEISKNENFKIHYDDGGCGAKPLSANHYFKIWKARFDMLSAKGVVFPGLEELVESFKDLPEETPLRILMAEYSDWHITFWLDDNDAVIGCLFKE